MNCGPQQEIPLTGGRTTSGITRIGDTVRRPLSETSAFVQPLLQHLKEVGFNGAPRFLGIDDKSREILSYFPGTVPSDIRWFSDSQLEAAAKLIQRYHNATVNLASAYHTEVICHHDLSPCNFVFAGTLPYAIIDFDAAAPGSRSADLSYAAWLWLDIGNPDIAPQEQKKRLVLFCQAYGMPFDQHFVETMQQRQTQLIAEGEKLSSFEMAAWAADCHAWTKKNLTDAI